MGRSPYQITALVSAWALAAWAVAGAVWASPPDMPGRETMWWALPLVYAAAAWAAGALADELEDFQRQLGLREKFAFFLGHVALFFTPIPLLRGFWFVWGMGLVMAALVVFLQREINFNRLALVCGLLWIARLARRPDDALWGSLLFAALLLVMLVSSHYYTMYRRYGVERGESARRFWRMAGAWCGVLLAGGGLVWLTLPRLTPVEFKPPPAPPPGSPAEIVTRPPIDFSFLFEIVLWSSVVFGILYAIYWIRAKLKGGDKTPFEVARATLQRVTEEVSRKTVQRWRANLLHPADRVIFYYNLFCETMGRFNLSRRPAMTPREYEGFLAEQSAVGRQRTDDLVFVTSLFQQALYGAEDITSVDSRHFQRLTHNIVRSHEKSFGSPHQSPDSPPDIS